MLDLLIVYLKLLESCKLKVFCLSLSFESLLRDAMREATLRILLCLLRLLLLPIRWYDLGCDRLSCTFNIGQQIHSLDIIIAILLNHLLWIVLAQSFSICRSLTPDNCTVCTPESKLFVYGQCSLNRVTSHLAFASGLLMKRKKAFRLNSTGLMTYQFICRVHVCFLPKLNQHRVEIQMRRHLLRCLEMLQSLVTAWRR